MKACKTKLPRISCNAKDYCDKIEKNIVEARKCLVSLRPKIAIHSNPWLYVAEQWLDKGLSQALSSVRKLRNHIS